MTSFILGVRSSKNAGNYAYMLGSGGASVKNADALMELGANATDEQMATLGVTAKDDQTLVVELENKVPYFTDLMAFPCYFPQNESSLKNVVRTMVLSQNTHYLMVLIR